MTHLFAGSLLAQALSLNGFAEMAFGVRVQNNPLFKDRDYTLNETRLRLQFSHFEGSADFYGAVDILADNVIGKLADISIREAYMQFSLGSRIDAKIGRQILTWGTGDLLFINDLFPKDYISFFTGREDQYLKLPSDAMKFGIFLPGVNIDLVFLPNFHPDLLPTGARLSSFNPVRNSITGPDRGAPVFSPEKKIGNGEIALRMYRLFGSFQVSGYLFNGFYKDPMGIDPSRGGLYYPKLSAFGTSVRGPLWQGVFSAEYGYHDSREDEGGFDPLIPNSQDRFLVGIERQWFTDFNAGVQYYVELMRDHNAYTNTLPQGAPLFDKTRQLLTIRLTQLLYYQDIRLSLFGFYGFTDDDWHLRPFGSFKYSDRITFSAGGNFFGGENIYTLFGQFENNNNAYFRVRYYF